MLNSRGARTLSGARAQVTQRTVKAAKKFEQAVEKGIAEVAIDNAQFQVQVNESVEAAGQKGIDHHTSFTFQQTLVRS